MDKDDIYELLITLKGMQSEISDLEQKLQSKTKLYLTKLHHIFDKEKITPIDTMEWVLETLEDD